MWKHFCLKSSSVASITWSFSSRRSSFLIHLSSSSFMSILEISTVAPVLCTVLRGPSAGSSALGLPSFAISSCRASVLIAEVVLKNLPKWLMNCTPKSSRNLAASGRTHCHFWLSLGSILNASGILTKTPDLLSCSSSLSSITLGSFCSSAILFCQARESAEPFKLTALSSPQRADSAIATNNIVSNIFTSAPPSKYNIITTVLSCVKKFKKTVICYFLDYVLFLVK